MISVTSLNSYMTSPRFKAASFFCPNCHALAQQSWSTCEATDEDGDSRSPDLFISTCFACNTDTVWRGSYRTTGSASFGKSYEIIFPTVKLGGPPRNPDMPDNAAQCYDEAASVVDVSPRSASALLRLALEVLLEDLYPDKAGNLNAMIGAAVADGLPRGVQQTMDYIRFSGNRSVHKFQTDDTPETAATLFSLLNIVVERLISQPKQLDSLYGGLPDGFRDQVERRDTTNPA